MAKKTDPATNPRDMAANRTMPIHLRSSSTKMTTREPYHFIQNFKGPSSPSSSRRSADSYNRCSNDL
ncbi:unnamed protein product [Haemonchus placei]|uniref:Ovule protein n=1 Tax=Haemonchus placei TaxID=6290 RepID=A0A0N4W9E7_HAEPC|nr:unnamed protein product [Haemonchus placei]